MLSDLSAIPAYLFTPCTQYSIEGKSRLITRQIYLLVSDGCVPYLKIGSDDARLAMCRTDSTDTFRTKKTPSVVNFLICHTFETFGVPTTMVEEKSAT